MQKRIKKKYIIEKLQKRLSVSHKGDNGHVLVVGGSLDYFGAPILAGMGAFRSGADLVSLFVPEVNFETTRASLPDFFVKKYPGEFLTERYVENILEYAKKCDCMLIGPGIISSEKTTEACISLIKNTRIPLIIDAGAISALKKIEKFPLPSSITITPHMNEFRNLVDKDIIIDENDPKSIVFLRSISMDLNMNILLKGPLDYCVSEEGEVILNETGNPGMTVGGTGDFLAGVVAGLVAQKYEAYEAVQIASYFVGKAGDRAFKELGNGLMASDLGTYFAKEMAGNVGIKRLLG
jgi:ADP-dependent NAD(P)H-hydrate dehydratase / NAD(P)H-hydrate epimerase